MSTDDFEKLDNTTIEDIVIKSCFKRAEIGSKIFPLLSPDLFFDKDTQTVVNGINAYYVEFGRYPRAKELYDLSLPDEGAKQKFASIGKIELSSYSDDILKTRIEEFLRGKLTYKAIKKTAEEWKALNFNTINGAVEEIKEAVNFSINNKVGISIKKDTDSLMDYLHRKMKIVPSAFKALNGLIDGGHPSKAVSMYLGEANMGKTTFLCNDAAFALEHGANVLYVTLEMPDFEIFKKIAANISGIKVNDLKNANTEEIKKAINSKCTGDLRIIEYPSFEMSAQDLKVTLNDLQYKEGFTPDIIFVDYVNCMIATKDSNGQRYDDLGFIMKELENIAKEFDVPVVSCSQLNRDAYGSLDVSAKNVGESLNIIKYCANAYAIMRDATMRSKGLFLLKIIKNRYGPNDIQFYAKGNMDIMKISDATRTEVDSIQQSIQKQNVVDLNGASVESIFDGND
jgi:archaellum biogenesis ATPase FlaH